MKANSSPNLTLALQQLEAAPLGAQNFEALQRAAALAQADAEANARAQLFPLLPNTTADAIAEFDLVRATSPRSSFDSRILEIHAAAIAENMEAMQRLLRSQPVLAMLEDALSAVWPVAVDRAKRVASVARGIALQLVNAKGDDAPPAAALLVSLSAIDDRIAEVAAKQKEHAEQMREVEERARIARAEASRGARRAAVEDLRRWFASRGDALFMYRDHVMLGGKYAFEVLSGDDPAMIPLWRVRHAIAARKTHESEFQCPAWQREWAPAEWKAYSDAIADLRARLSNISDRVFSWGPIESADINGPSLAAAALVFEADRQGVKPSSVRKCIAAVQRFDMSYVWRGPSYQGFELDEVAESGIESFERADRATEHGDKQQQVARDIAAWHSQFDEGLRLIHEGEQ